MAEVQADFRAWLAIHAATPEQAAIIRAAIEASWVETIRRDNVAPVG